MSAITGKVSSPETNRAETASSAATPKSWFSGFSFSFFGRKVVKTDPKPGAACRATTEKAASSKFKISCSWWSGTKITISKSHDLSNQSISSTEDANELLQQLTSLQGKGTLVLRKTSSGKSEFQYKKFWFAPSATEKEKAAQYINSVLRKAYPQAPQGTKGLLAKNLTAYLLPTKIDPQREEIFSKKFKTLLNLYESASTQPADILARVEEAKSNQEIEQIPATTSQRDHLKSRGVVIGKQIGEGAFGSVYTASISSKQYVYKEENNAGVALTDPRILTNNRELNGGWHRHGDIAASRLEDLPHFAKATAFILKITEPGKEPEKWYVSTEQAKDFGKTLPSGTEVVLCGQLMERAPGKELRNIIIEGNSTFQGSDHFNTISNQLFEFLEKTYERNLIHRDLKTENLMFDADPRSATYRQLTVIDFGLGGVYGKRHKMLPEATSTGSGNPLRSTRLAGTPVTLAPAVLNQQLYGSEVDFHSVGAILIECLRPKEFNTVFETFFDSNKEEFIPGSKIPTSTQEYLEILDTESELAKILDANPHMAKTIDLFFAVASATPEKRDDAFKTLKTHIETVVRPAIQRQQQEQSRSIITGNSDERHLE